MLFSGVCYAFDDVDGVIPKEDAYAPLMLHAFPTIAPEWRADQEHYFSRPVPKIIHQFTRDIASKEELSRLSPWASYASLTGFEFKVWSLEDFGLDIFAQYAAVREAATLAQDRGRFDVAEQLLELLVLTHHGGVVVSKSARPPQIQNQVVGLQSVIDLRGLSVATSLRARDVGHMSIYITHALMSAPARHPWIMGVTALAADNTLNLFNSGHEKLPARYFGGNAFLSRNLYGSFHVLLFTYLQSLEMFPLTFSEDSLDALD